MTLSLKDHIVEWNSHKNMNPELMKLQVGQVFANAKVQKLVYGGSYIVNFPDSGSNIQGFLHKIHTSERPQKKEDAESEEEEPQQEELTVGQKLESVKIKEINFFDGMPIVSIR
jgi:hypothetical protein